MAYLDKTNYVCTKPILFLIFNRKRSALEVIKQIKKVKPTKLFVAADGPRLDVQGEKKACDDVQRSILQEIDWECEVKTLFRENNLGCKIAVSSAIDWFFSQVDNGIILEDDCLPEIDFFKFVSTMLDKYKDDNRIWSISGNNFLFDKSYLCTDSYYFSATPHIWGWAAWKRVWDKYNVDIPLIDRKVIKRNMREMFNYSAYIFWLKTLDKVIAGKVNTWDSQFTLAAYKHNGLNIIPRVNLVKNIGFGDESTHTHGENTGFSMLTTFKLGEPISHPKKISRNVTADNIIQKQNFYGDSFLYRQIKRTLVLEVKRIIKKLL